MKTVRLWLLTGIVSGMICQPICAQSSLRGSVDAASQNSRQHTLQFESQSAANAPQASGPVMQHVGLDAALEAAVEHNTLLLVVFTASWDPASTALVEDTLNNAAWRNSGGPLQLTILNVDDYGELAEQFQVRKFPHMAVLTGELKVVLQDSGAKTVAELNAMLVQARMRVKAGQWEGSAIETHAQMTLPTDLSPEEIQRILDQLGTAPPVERDRIAAMLHVAHNRAIPIVFQGMADDYLGTRIQSATVFHSLAKTAPQFDPWDSREERVSQLTEIANWWKEVGQTLPPPEDSVALDADEQRSVEEALLSVLSDNALQRTRGMTALVRMGHAVLPQVRQAIADAESKGDRKSIWLLEDVRWAILVPDSLEMIVRVRHDLARGISEKRQTATARLAQGGQIVLPVLRELVRDDDPLVRETAATTLTQIGGSDAMAAMAVLLEASDANLRMIAAQELGKTKNSQAARYLVEATRDEDEVVACVAIAALEEISAKNEVQTLIKCLSDKRWRVRAAAAEVLGKLELSEAIEPLTRLLQDADPFVVQSVLEALKSLGSVPDTDQLKKLLKSSPELSTSVMELLLRRDDATSLRTIEEIYNTLPDIARATFVAGLSARRNYSQNDDWHWKPLLDQIVSSGSLEVLHSLATVLQNRSFRLRSEYLSSLLGSEHPPTQMMAADMILETAAFHYGLSTYRNGTDFNIMSLYDPSVTVPSHDDAADITPAEETEGDLHTADSEAAAKALDIQGASEAYEYEAGDFESPQTATPAEIEAAAEAARRAMEEVRGNVPVEEIQIHDSDGEMDPHQRSRNSAKASPQRAAYIRQLHEQWHGQLLKLNSEQADWRIRLACSLTSADQVDVQALEELLDDRNIDLISQHDNRAVIVGLMLKRLPMPEGQVIIDKAEQSTNWFAMLLSASRYAPAELSASLLDQGAFFSRMEQANEESLTMLVEHLINGNSGLLAGEVATVTARLTQLAQSDSAAIRSLGIFFLQDYQTPQAYAEIERLLHDENKWVRIAAIRAFAHRTDISFEEITSTLSPLLETDDEAVLKEVAMSLLLPELRNKLHMQSDMNTYQFESISVRKSRGIYRSEMTARPPEIRKPVPAFLNTIRRKTAAPVADEQLRFIYPLLLAQYGDFSGMEKSLHAWQENPDPASAYVLVIGLSFSGDDKYLAPAQYLIQHSEDRYDLREILKMIYGKNAPAIRQLRRDVNHAMWKLSE